MAISTHLRRFLKNVSTHLPGALDGAIQITMFEVVDEFLDFTDAWKEEIPIGVLTTSKSYDLFSNEYGVSRVHRLISIKNSDDLPQSGSMAIPGILVLPVFPQEAETWTIEVTLNITDPVDSDAYPKYPAWILQKYRTGLIDGVLGQMMGTPAKPYTNERLAVYHLRRFRAAMVKAKAEAAHKNILGGQAWRFPQSFGSITKGQN